MATSLFDDLEVRLRRLGLRGVDKVRTHANRTVMLTLRGRVLRLHAGYAHAPDRVLSAIITYLRRGIRRDTRAAAQRAFLEFPVHVHVAPRPRRAHADTSLPGDEPVLARLADAYGRLNARHFDGRLDAIPIRLSGRMRRRLGELAVSLTSGRPSAISISRRHVRAGPWAEVEHTLLHEMVHQWQAETGAPLDHGPGFRRKAREVGVVPRATRRLDRQRGGAIE